MPALTVCDAVTEATKDDNVKTRLCKERRKVLRTEQLPEDSTNILFSEGVLRLGSKTNSFLRIHHTGDSGEKKEILVFAGENGECLLRRRTYFLLDCTFENCCSRKHIARKVAYIRSRVQKFPA